MVQYMTDKSGTINQQNKLFEQYYGNYFVYSVQMYVMDILGPQRIHSRLLLVCFMRRNYSLLYEDSDICYFFLVLPRQRVVKMITIATICFRSIYA